MNKRAVDGDAMGTSFEEIIAGFEESPEYKAEMKAYAFIERCTERMRELGISKAELARRLCCSKPYISQLFMGVYGNMKLVTMQKLADALEFDFEMDIASSRSKRRNNRNRRTDVDENAPVKEGRQALQTRRRTRTAVVSPSRKLAARR